MSYDLFISYSRRDNVDGRVTELKTQIETDYCAFAGEDLVCFFDKDDIKGMDDWRHRILQGLRESSLLLLVLSPGYLASEYCEWEIVEYLKYEHSRAAAGQGVAPIYFVEVPGLDTPGFEEQTAAWVARVRRRNHFDLRPWHEEGKEALKRTDVHKRLKELEDTLHTSISKMRRLANATGNLPAHNPHFVGRETEMLRLHESAGLGRFGVLTAIQGMGGLGKTALAIQYAFAYADFYPGGRWLVGCAGEASLASVIRRLDVDLKVELTDDEKRDDNRAARRILAELESRAIASAMARAGEKEPPQPRVLLLLDNVDVPELFQPPQSDLLSGKRWLHVLATTRMGADDFGHDSDRQTLLTVDELPIEDAVRLIESHQPQGSFPNEDERAAAEGIAKLLGGFTLAVEVVAVHLGERMGQITCAAFLKRLQKEGYEVFARGTKRAKLISVTLGPTLDLLTPEESLVLAYAALLPADTIPLPWLRALATEEYPELGQDTEPGYDDPWLSLVNHLLGLRLLQVVDIDPDNNTPRLVRMHRLTAELVRERDNKNNPTLNRMDKVAGYALSRSKFLRDNWLDWKNRWEIHPSGQFALKALDEGLSNATEIANYIALCMLDLANYTTAEPLLRRALKIAEDSYGLNHPNVAIGLNNLALLLKYTNHLSEAEPFYRRALKIAEDSYGPDHPIVAIDLNNLAQLLHATNRLSEAEPLMRRVFKIDEDSYGPDHPRVATDLNNLAQLLKATNRLSEAEPLYRRALKIDEDSYGPDHPSVAIRLNNLADLLRVTNHLAEAESFNRRSLKIDEDSYGPNHPRVAIDLNNLAQLLQATNRLSKAEPLMRRALKIDEDSYGLDHPDVATDLNNLARLLQDTNRLSEAEPLMLRMVEIFLKFTHDTGHPHPHLQAISNYTKLLQDMGRSAEYIRSTLYELGKRYGVDLVGAGGRVENELSPELRKVIEIIMKDPSNAQAIIDKLQQEDHKLYNEFFEWYESQQ